MTTEEIVVEINKLSEKDRQIVLTFLEVGINKPQMTQDEFLQILLSKGIISDASEYLG